MQLIIVVVVVGLLGGIAVGLQTPLASLIGQRLGVLESIFIVHLGGMILSGIPLLLARGGKLGEWQRVPWYALGAGVFGLVVIGSINYTVPRLGATVTVILVVVGQIVISLLVDHFGLFGTDVRPIDLSRIVGVGVLFLGIWLVIR
ncbi:MAG: DMT family transporter [Anaerolineaceae bacterium]|nr:DMT family transporter [Anaerolineaceae bacterium]